MIYALNPKKYTKYTNYIMQKNFFIKNIENKFRKQILKFLNHKDLFIEKKTLILKSNQINIVKTKRKVMSLTFV